jgi:glycine oxidase
VRTTRRAFLGTALAATRAWGTQAAKSFDAVVIGAGAIGSTTAYFLAAEGVKVCLVDKGPAGREASWASAGMIQPSGSARAGSWPSRAAFLSRRLYDELEPKLLEETGRRIGYGGEGGLILAFSDDEAATLSRLAKDTSGEDHPPELLQGAGLRKREPGLADEVVAALLLPAHRFLDARTYTSVVAEAARKRGAVVREESPVTGLLWEGRKVTGVQTASEKIAAGTVVNCAGAWAGRIDARLPLPIRPVHGQILALQGPKAGLRHNLQRLGAGGYATPRADGRVLVGATSEDFGYEKKVTPEGLRELATLVRELVPNLAEHRVLDHWSGLRPGSADGLPAIGPDPRTESGYLWAAGHGGYGMMQGPASARAVADLVLQRDPPMSLDAVRPARLLG